MRGGRTQPPDLPSGSGRRSSMTLIDAGVRSSDGAELLGVLDRVGRGPADDLADLGLPVPVQHDDAEAVGERRACSGESGAVMLRT